MTENSIEIQDNCLSPIESAELVLTENLPWILMTLLERRYLDHFQPEQWDLSEMTGFTTHPLLQEMTSLGRAVGVEKMMQAMPHVLNACSDQGHAVVMTVHGRRNRQQFYIGARRIAGSGASSTDAYLKAEASAFKAYFAGLELQEPRLLDDQDMPELTSFLQNAPAMMAVTGIPSFRNQNGAFQYQSLDHLVNAISDQEYALMIVAEPLNPVAIDQIIDTCRKLKSEIHTYIRRTKSIVRGTSKSEGTSVSEVDRLPSCLQTSLLFINMLARQNPYFDIIAGALTGLNILMMSQSNKEQVSQQTSTSVSWQESGSIELFDANAEACENLLAKYIERLTIGRCNGLWKTAIYIAAESTVACKSVGTALRSVVSGDSTYLEPIRALPLPAHVARNVMEQGQLLRMSPKSGSIRHPFGTAFDFLTTCISSDELSVLINIPQQELPGLPMRDREKFGLTVPAGEENSTAVEVGNLLDSKGQVLDPVTLFSDELNRHCFVTGATGYGKTNTCIQLLLDSYRKWNTPFLVIEPAKAEYQRLTRIPDLAQRLRVFHVGIGDESHMPFRLNPFYLMPGASLGRHIDLLKAVFNASFPMFAGMTYVLEEAILDVYLDRGWSLYTSNNVHLKELASLEERSVLTPCLEDLCNQIEVVMQRKKYGEETHQNMGAALRSRLNSLMVGNKGLALNTRRCLPMSHLLSAPTVIELRNLGDDEEKSFVMALLFMFLYEYAETRQETLPEEEREHLQHITLIEEAHRLLKASPRHVNAEVGDPQAKAVTMFTDMLAEMRVYGEGFIIADQIPTKLAPETIKNTNIKIVHRLTAPDDRSLMGSCLNLRTAQTRTMNNLKPGQAIIHTERFGDAVLTQVYPAKERISPAGKEAAGQPNGKLMADRYYYYRHSGCQSCPLPCQYYHVIEEANVPFQDSFQSFAAGVLFGNWEAGQRYWSEWVKDWQRAGRQQFDHGVLGSILFCAATQEMYAWLGRTILSRTQAQRWYPQDRMLREVAARAVSPLLRSLAFGEDEPHCRKTFDEAQAVWYQKIFGAPPEELDGCTACPKRCKALAYALPAGVKIRKSMESAARESSSPSTRLEVIKKLAGQQLPALAYRSVDQQFDRDVLYCLLVNTCREPSDRPVRDELLVLIKNEK